MESDVSTEVTMEPLAGMLAACSISSPPGFPSCTQFPLPNDDYVNSDNSYGWVAPRRSRSKSDSAASSCPTPIFSNCSSPSEENSSCSSPRSFEAAPPGRARALSDSHTPPLRFQHEPSTQVNGTEEIASLYMELLQYKMRIWNTRGEQRGVEKQRGRVVRRHGGFRKLDPLRTCIVGQDHASSTTKGRPLTVISMEVAVDGRRY
jgi:hypothetical protein